MFSLQVLLLLILSQAIILYKSFSFADPSFKYCEGSIPTGSVYMSNLKLLLQTLPSEAENNNGYYNGSVGTSPNQVYGLIMCYADASPENCNSCLVGVNSTSSCNDNGDVSKHYDSCFVHYSNYSFFSKMGNYVPVCLQKSPTPVPNFLNNPYVQLLIINLTTEASNSPYRYATGNTTYEGNQTLQMLLQCTRDLVPSECSKCISNYIKYASDRGANCSDWQGARIMGPSCYVRYDLDSFNVVEPPGTAAKRERKSSSTAANAGIALASVFMLLMLLLLGAWFWIRRQKRASAGINEDSMEEPFQQRPEMKPPSDVKESAELMQFDLKTLQYATDNFSNENKLGEGGFGQVFKGRLQNGQKIAVKRLSSASKQGIPELENEIKTLGGLKHRNVVQVLGCCMEDNEKLLCYEYLPKGSLDMILFENDRRGELDWTIRFKIIEGVCRGLVYLHIESGAAIIHRDLKAGNILLDEKMNPKISDFGIARLFDEDQTHKITTKVIGTIGYLAPEIFSDNAFSAKSDVFSFGVLILEIVTGQKCSPNFIGHVWKHWEKKEVLELKDAILPDTCLNQVTKCIHIGLLCVKQNPKERPNISDVYNSLVNRSPTMLSRPPEDPRD